MEGIFSFERFQAFSGGIFMIMAIIYGGTISSKGLFYTTLMRCKYISNMLTIDSVNQEKLTEEIDSNEKEMYYYIEKYTLPGNEIPFDEDIIYN